TAPQGTSTLVGSIVSLNVQASSATPLAYQWLRNSATLSGATSSNYTTSYAQAANAGDYQVVVSNSSGAVTSVVAHVTVVTADQTNIIDQLVGHYPFEQQFADLSPSGNSASAVGTTTWTITGKCGGAGLEVSTVPDGSAFNFATLGAPDDFTFS